MIIKSLRVRNYRSIADAALGCDPLTVLVGANGAGKSNFLRALALFYEGDSQYGREDFFNGDTLQDILIDVTFGDLTDEETSFYGEYVRNDVLAVQKKLSYPPGKGSQLYYGQAFRCPDFQAVRQQDKAADKKVAYEELRQREPYAELPPWKNQTQGPADLQAWEAAHPEQCEWVQDDGQFFGFTGVAQGKLSAHTKFVFVPAICEVRDQTDETKKSALSELVDIVVRNALASSETYSQLEKAVNDAYEALTSAENAADLQKLSTKLTKTLDDYASNSGVSLSWDQSGKPEVKLPKVVTRLIEDRYENTVDRAGHGLQRAFLLALLQHLQVAKHAVDNPAKEEAEAVPGAPLFPAAHADDPSLPGLTIAVEEPELFQHPSRQRLFRRVFERLVTGALPGVARQMQIIYCTHAPLLVGIEQFDEVRLVRKYTVEKTLPQATRVLSVTLAEAAERLSECRHDGEAAGSQDLSPSGFAARIQGIMTPWMNEGFFADTVVLVEGEGDREALTQTAIRRFAYDLDKLGISVIPCGGKNNMDRPFIIFSKLGISVFCVWDNDKPAALPEPLNENNRDSIRGNRHLLRVVGAPATDWPDCVGDNHAVLPGDLDAVLRTDFGDKYDELMAECKSEFEYGETARAKKNAIVVRALVNKAADAGVYSDTLSEVVEQIVKRSGKHLLSQIVPGEA